MRITTTREEFDDPRARDFVDSILEVNRQHGVDTAPAVIGYAAAVKAAASMFRHPVSRDTGTGTTEGPDHDRH